MQASAQDLRREIEAVLPRDLPDQDRLVAGLVRHLFLVLEASREFNLTRITAPREAAVKHVLDSLGPWPRLRDLGTLLDLGSGAGYPGVPLALAFPDSRVMLAESVRKKASFLRSVVEELDPGNVTVHAERAEVVLARLAADGVPAPVDAVVVRAAGSARKVLRLLRPVRDQFRRLYLYKGPEAEREIEQAEPEARRMNLSAAIRWRQELPYGMGSRCLVEYHPSS